MESQERSPKPPKKVKLKSNEQTPKSDQIFTGDESVSQLPDTSQPIVTPTLVEPQAISGDKPFHGYTEHSELNSSPQIKPRRISETRFEQPELSPEKCQRMKIIDCDKPVSRILFECYYCFQGLISEYTGEPIIGEFKGRPSVQPIKVKCPNCEQTAIRINAGKILSTTAIPSPWS